jgi:hypothetical protein
MTPNDVRSEITRLAVALLEAELAVAVNTPIMHTNGSVVRVTWPASLAESGLFATNLFASIVEYRKFLLGRHYTCLMEDGGLIQISVDVKNNQVIGHRMCFYPCPLILPEGLPISDFDEVDFLFLQELENQIEAIETRLDPSDVNLRLRSPIRFDYNPDHATEPPCHLHLSYPNIRVPVYSSLSLGHFVQFVLRHFYPAAWADPSLTALTRWPIEQQTRSIRAQDEFELHVSCRHQILL